MKSNKKAIAYNEIARRKRNLTIIAVIFIFVFFAFSQFVLSIMVPDLQRLIDCKNNVIAYSDCKYIGLISILFAPWVIVALIAAIVVAIILYKKRQIIKQSKQMDSIVNIISCFAIIICVATALFLTAVVVYWIIAWRMPNMSQS